MINIHVLRAINTDDMAIRKDGATASGTMNSHVDLKKEKRKAH